MKPWDLIVVGGGPAGMMAAGTAAAGGRRVLLLEKNASLGKKLLISGGGRCNFTNAEPDKHKLAAKYGKKGPVLLSPFTKFSSQDALEFFASRGMPWKIENDYRAFPQSNTSQSVMAVLLDYLKAGKVEIKTQVKVTGFLAADGRITAVKTAKGPIEGREFVLATGGTSHPETGSTGDGYRWLADLGHTVTLPEPSLVPVAVRESQVKQLMGLSFPDLRLNLLQGGKRVESRDGKVLFTHFGLSGPLILNLSTTMERLAKSGPLTLSFDFYPKLDHGSLDRHLLSVFAAGPNKQLKNALVDLHPPRLVDLLLQRAGLDGSTVLNKLGKDGRLALGKLLKDFAFTFDHLLDEEWAVTSSGGVDLDEVDFRTMQSRLYPNLRLAGDILDFDRPSGGYSLQICWATGFVAGKEGS